ncbi:pseudoazurin [Grimontia sp. NTOU-MAR1]|uniref:pseudoazurin n=1 Tax=Grimontia sp. NTOU-MAR1 TaxID=3111011 RepID=UPI002DBC4596|nr:pseudoazurin [Grimontia sp. NTOU-MAR1]WRV97922.1 pseudoazurin [Grimontia sp. NTOU-MAR1]
MKKLTLLLTLLFPVFGATAEHKVKMLNGGPEGVMVFSPAYLKINAGDTVTFVPSDMGHNAESVFTPEGSAGWKGAIGKSVTATFDKEGLYVYQCTPHAIMAMVGIIQVGDALNKAEFETFSDQMESTFVMNKGRLKTYGEQVK